MATNLVGMASEGEQTKAGNPRKKIPFRLTADALQGLDALSVRHGTTQTGLIEAMGQLGRSGEPMSWEAIVAKARSIDSERRSRRPTGNG